MRVQETFRKLSHLRFSTAKYFSSKPKHESYDAVIVGGGHNGLVAAAYLSKSGLKYVVLDLIVSYSLLFYVIFQDLRFRKTTHNWRSFSD